MNEIKKLWSSSILSEESIHTLQLQDALNTLVATWAALMLDNMTSQQDLIQIFYFDII